MSIGREGPFIHMACILGYNLTRLPYFKTIKKQERLLRQMLAAAVSAGITAVFGAPIGGVLFGIEITATVSAGNDKRIYASDLFLSLLHFDSIIKSTTCGDLFFALLFALFALSSLV